MVWWLIITPTSDENHSRQYSLNAFTVFHRGFTKPYQMIHHSSPFGCGHSTCIMNSVITQLCFKAWIMGCLTGCSLAATPILYIYYCASALHYLCSAVWHHALHLLRAIRNTHSWTFLSTFTMAMPGSVTVSGVYIFSFGCGIIYLLTAFETVFQRCGWIFFF